MKFTLETRGAPHTQRELARFAAWEAANPLEAVQTQEQWERWQKCERAREKRLAIAFYMDTRDRNSRATLLQVCSSAGFRRQCREMVAQFPPRLAKFSKGGEA